MRVLLVDGGSEYGGQARHVCDLARGLSARGHTVGVAFRNPQMEEGLRSVDATLYRLPFHMGVDIVSLRNLCAILKGMRFDIVHTHGVRGGLTAKCAVKLSCRAKQVHTVHGAVREIMQGERILSRSRSALHSCAEARLGVMADRVITLSQDVRRACVRSGIASGKIVTIHHGVDLSRYECLEDKVHARGKIGVPTGCRLVGVVATFAPDKNLRGFLEIAKRVSRECDDVMFALVGDGPEARELRRQARLLGISHLTVFTGFRRDVPAILPAFDLFVSSSLRERHPVSVLEAMAAGLPVVATSVTGVADAVVDGLTGYTVCPGDVEATADRVLRLLSSANEARIMGMAGRRRVIDRFGFDQMIRETEQLYIALAERNVYRQTVEAF